MGEAENKSTEKPWLLCRAVAWLSVAAATTAGVHWRQQVESIATSLSNQLRVWWRSQEAYGYYAAAFGDTSVFALVVDWIPLFLAGAMPLACVIPALATAITGCRIAKRPHAQQSTIGTRVSRRISLAVQAHARMLVLLAARRQADLEEGNTGSYDIKRLLSRRCDRNGRPTEASSKCLDVPSLATPHSSPAAPLRATATSSVSTIPCAGEVACSKVPVENPELVDTTSHTARGQPTVSRTTGPTKRVAGHGCRTVETNLSAVGSTEAVASSAGPRRKSSGTNGVAGGRGRGRAWDETVAPTSAGRTAKARAAAPAAAHQIVPEIETEAPTSAGWTAKARAARQIVPEIVPAVRDAPAIQTVAPATLHTLSGTSSKHVSPTLADNAAPSVTRATNALGARGMGSPGVGTRAEAVSTTACTSLTTPMVGSVDLDPTFEISAEVSPAAESAKMPHVCGQRHILRSNLSPCHNPSSARARTRTHPQSSSVGAVRLCPGGGSCSQMAYSYGNHLHAVQLNAPGSQANQAVRNLSATVSVEQYRLELNRKSHP